ncbi:hypothetical protein Q5530_12430 [Saccharothrix sp. BKS2]|uniref:MAB_1171c family putative transporter n=1 Tax=Saccharothrix sp. BKS2 TaxID=3064400 RepID=UPI0039E8346E
MLSFFLPVLVVVTAAFWFWMSSYRHTRKPGVRAMCVALLLLDLGVLMGAISFAGRSFDLATEALPLQFMQHVCILTAAFYLQMFCLHLTSDTTRVVRQARLRRFVLVAALLGLTAFYFLGPWQHGITEVHSAYGDRPWVTQYLAVYSAYFGWVLLDVLLMSRLARHISRPNLRLGLRLLGAGSVTGLLYVAWRFGFSVAAALGVPVPPDSSEWSGSNPWMFLAVMLLMAGVLVPPIGVRLEARRTHAALHPLWSALTTMAPELVYGRRSRGDRLRIRVTEIRDVLIGPLHAYLDPEVTAEVRGRADDLGMPEHEARATAEAATIAVALEAKRRNLPPLTTAPVVIGETDDAAQLVRIADAFTGSDLVTAAVKEFQDHHDHVH